MNKTLKNATVKKYYYKSHQQLKEHLYSFVMAYNYAKLLKTLKGLTPYEFICDQWTKFPDLFILPSYSGTVQSPAGAYFFNTYFILHEAKKALYFSVLLPWLIHSWVFYLFGEPFITFSSSCHHDLQQVLYANFTRSLLSDGKFV